MSKAERLEALTETTISDLEMSALNALLARRGAVPDDELLHDVIEEVLERLTPDDLLAMAREDPTHLLERTPLYVGGLESPAHLIRQNCHEYLHAVLAMKLVSIDNDDVVDPSDRQTPAKGER